MSRNITCSFFSTLAENSFFSEMFYLRETLVDPGCVASEDLFIILRFVGRWALLWGFLFNDHSSRSGNVGSFNSRLLSLCPCVLQLSWICRCWLWHRVAQICAWNSSRPWSAWGTSMILSNTNFLWATMQTSSRYVTWCSMQCKSAFFDLTALSRYLWAHSCVWWTLVDNVIGRNQKPLKLILD